MLLNRYGHGSEKISETECDNKLFTNNHLIYKVDINNDMFKIIVCLLTFNGKAKYVSKQANKMNKAVMK